jgi:hypothetical protein
MALQLESALAMTTLGIVGDSPADPLQPPLVDAIHLRWAFGTNRSFPWHGYYLFRRPSREKRERGCVSRYLGSVGDAVSVTHVTIPQSLNSASYNTPMGIFTSDQILLVTDDFPATGFGEMDLRNRNFLRFTCAEPAAAIQFKVGLRKGEDGSRDLNCIRFSREDAGVITNPRTKNNVGFTTFDFQGNQKVSSDIKPVAGGIWALDMGHETRIDLPCAADHVTMLVVNTASPGKVIGLDKKGKQVADAPMERTENAPEMIRLEGKGIVQVVVYAPQNEVLLLSFCYHCEKKRGTQGDLTTIPKGLKVRYFAGPTLLHEEPINGAPGSIVEGHYSADHLTAIEFTGGNAAVIDICYESVSAAFQGGWKPVQKCPQPIYLPVRHLNYPASGSLATNQAASEGEALGRIRYGNPNDWSGARFDAMHDAMRDIVAGGPVGSAMKDVGPNNVAGVSSDPAEQDSPNLAKLRPMNYLVMGSLYAPIAQMLGLYWADETAQKGKAYDYLIVADLNNVGHADVNTMLAWLNSPALNFNDIDAWICFNCSLGTPAALAQPTGLKSYSLPGTTSDNPDGSIRDMTCNAGLKWDIPMTSGKLNAESSIMYVVRRADLHKVKPPAPVSVAQHKAITKTPHLVTNPIVPSGTPPAPPADWPTISFSYIDSGRSEGWYSYLVNGVDIYGRYSPPSDPAAWHQWTPEPDPTPWYYDDTLGNGAVNPHAISLLDKTPPPPPTAVEAFALDPQDPNLIRDAAYNIWFATLSPAEKQSVIGLRVRWLWTYSHMRQAPDTKEFRVYYDDGQPNVLKGRVTAVAPAAADHSSVTTTIAHGEAANAFVDGYLRTGGRSFKITGSSAASPLVLTVLNVLPDHSVAPDEGGVCSVTVPPGHALYLDLSRPTRWDERVWVVDYDDFTAEGVAAAPMPGSDAQLAGENATSVATQVTFPAGIVISAIRPMYFHLFLSEDVARPSRIYKVIGVNAPARTVMLDGSPNFPGGVSGWELGVLVRRYEVFLPVPADADRDGLALNPTLQKPVAHAQLGVTAVDDKDHTGDDPARAGDRWGDRTGNESRNAGPATVFRIHRVPPPPVVMPPDDDDVFASKADYHGKSYYTFRWVPMADVDTHIFRALDQAVYQRDWIIRQTRDNLSGSTHQRFFPDGWNAGRRNAAAAELNAINGAGDYGGLSADAKDVLGRLPGNEGFNSKGTLNERDWLVRRTHSSLAPGDLEYFPPEWGAALKRQGAANLLNAINSFADYDELTNDANRVLAALPGNETAFQQMTDRPLPNVGAQTANRLGPDNPATFPIDPNLRAYIDNIDGRSSNKYFYRAAFIDTAQNIGPMGLSSPPIHMPDIMPPRMPVFTRVLAGDPNPAQPGDRKITLRWTSNREPDLASYRVYRTDTQSNARDIRLMDRVHEVNVLPGIPAARPAEVVWLDDTVLGLVTYYYRLVAVDSAGNQSVAAAAIAARAYDTALPDVPVLEMEWVEIAGNVKAEISWNSTHQVMIQRREGPGNWIDLAQWRDPGIVTIRDPFSDPAKTYHYRALVRKYTGALKRGEPATLEPQI